MAERVRRGVSFPPLVLELLIVGAWLALLIHSHLRFRTPAPSATGGMALLSAAGETSDAEWVGVYLEGQKIGAGMSDTQKLKDGYRLQQRTFLRMRAFEQDKEITTVFLADTDKDKQLKRFSFMLSAPPSQIDVRGEVHGQVLQLELLTGGEVQRREIPVTDIPEVALTFKERIAGKNPNVGDTLELPYFDPASMSQQKMQIKVVSEGVAQIDGKQVPTLTLEATYHGFVTTQLITRSGLTLEETNTLGMKLKRESRDQAMYEGWSKGQSPVDIIALSAVPLNEAIPSARTTQYLRAHLSGGGVEVLLGAPKEGAVAGDVEVVIPPRKSWKNYQIPMVDSRFANELAGSALVQKDDPTIFQMARSIVGDTLKAVDAAELLNTWVHERLRKAPVMGIPSALDILKTGEGDCNEHTTLYTALARAVGIPTRMAAGIVYSEDIGPGPSFYYHAWPEVYLGEWVPVDPTFGQFPADATHIKLVEGELENQLSLMRVVGNLRVDVRESRQIDQN
jgi:hypothetical protein